MVAIDLGLKSIRTRKFWRAVGAEFFGMIFFLLAVTCVCLNWKNSLTSEPTSVAANNVEIGIGIGLAITSIAMAIGHVSGGHLNPAVSLGMIVGRRIPILQGLCYIIAQVLGGLVGAALTYTFTPDTRRASLGQTKLADGLRPGQGFGLELLFTFLLVFFVLSITDSKKNVEPYGTTLGIGVVILVAHVCIVPFTGCGINPARSFAPAVIMNKWDNHWVYWVGPLLGGTAAALIYNFIFYVEEEDYAEANVEEAEEADYAEAEENSV